MDHEKYSDLNDGFSGTGGKTAWDAVKLLKSGLLPSCRAPPTTLRREDGSLASTHEEIAYTFSFFFSTIYGRVPIFDPLVLDLLPQESFVPDLDASPSDDEILQAVNKLHPSSHGASGLHARLWQALSSTSGGFAFIRHFVIHFWLTETPHVECEIGLLSILPKKGDMHNPGNYKGSLMLEVAYKIVANIIRKRVKPIKESNRLNHESQN